MRGEKKLLYLYIILYHSMLLVDNLFYILLFIVFIAFYAFYKINEKLHKSPKFRTFISVSMFIATFILAVGVLFQIVEYKSTQYKITIQTFTNFSKDFINDILMLFIQHPQMNYFYRELFFNQVTENIHRNIELEQLISMSIFSKTLEQITVINVYHNYHEIAFIKETLIKILNNFLQSPNFKYYYTDCYKPTLAGPIMIYFMQQNFGI
jgi:predicted PurR-regulated permease PerM